MGKRVGHGGDGCGCLHFTEPVVICKNERAVVHKWPADSSAELVADKGGDRCAAQVKVVPGIEGSVPVDFEQRSVEIIASRFGRRLDDAASIPSVLGIEGLCENVDLRHFIESEKD